jgi:asparagine synthase (glutamine-hydrolysing)
MCGICGFLGDVSPKVLRVMCQAMAHRGPDDWGLFNDRSHHVGLGHTRLSIIDLSPKGHQPMGNEAGDVWIVFNGEIYGFRELRDDLLRRGHIFVGTSDTEVLVHLYEEQSTDFVNALNGMFAIAVWDQRAKQLFLARDRAGIKPLYYIFTPGYFAFASEIKALLAANLAQRIVNRSAISQYLEMKFVPGDETAFKDIRRLLPGQWVAVNAKREVRSGLFGSRPLNPDSNPRSENDYADDLRFLIQEAVRDQMVADVPVGAFLSGGLDSSIIVSEMARNSSQKVRAFTVEYKGERTRFNEGRNGRISACHAGIDHTLVSCRTDDVPPLMPLLIYHLDEPISEPLLAPTFLLAREARKTVTVVLTGEGADELFAGYARYKVTYYVKLLQRVPLTLRCQLWRLVRKAFGHQDLWSRILRATIDARSVSEWCWVFRPEEIATLTGLRCENDTDCSEVLNGSRKGAILDFLLEVDFRSRMPEYILTCADKMSMGNSLEMRPPFLDNRILDFASRLPNSLKLHRLQEKFILRRAFEGILPPHILRRQKLPFSAPYELWIQTLVRKYLGEPECCAAVLIDQAELNRLLTGDSYYRGRITEKIWAVLILELWHRIFISQSINPLEAQNSA